MLLDVCAVAAVLSFGNIAFRHFEPHMPLWRRFLNALLVLGITAVISWYFGRRGVVIGFAVAMLRVIFKPEPLTR